MKKNKAVADSKFECVGCGTTRTFYQDKGWRKSEGHVKTSWCFKCKKETKHIEKKDHSFAD